MKSFSHRLNVISTSLFPCELSWPGSRWTEYAETYKIPKSNTFFFKTQNQIHNQKFKQWKRWNIQKCQIQTVKMLKNTRFQIHAKKRKFKHANFSITQNQKHNRIRNRIHCSGTKGGLGVTPFLLHIQGGQKKLTFSLYTSMVWFNEEDRDNLGRE